MKRLLALALLIATPTFAALDDFGSKSITTGTYCKDITRGEATAAILITGTWTGTGTFQRNDGRLTPGTPATAWAVNVSSRQWAQTFTANATFLMPIAGASQVCVNFAPGSGTMNIFIDLSMATFPGALSFIADGTGTPGSPPGNVIADEVPDVTVSGTISAQCSTPTTGCSAGQWVRAKMGGRNSVSGILVPSNFTGTLTCYYSKDGGTTWVQGMIRNLNLPGNEGPSATTSYTLTSAYAGSSTTSMLGCTSPYGGATDVAIVSTAAVTNTAAVSFTVSNAQSHIVETLASSKGNQGSGGVGLSVQELKDAGRTTLAFTVDSLATTQTAELLFTTTKSANQATATTFTSYTITSGKTLRLQSICISGENGGTTPVVSRLKFRIRANTAGATTTGSAIQKIMTLYVPATAKTGTGPVCESMPDGYEYAGDGTKSIGFTIESPEWVTTTQIPVFTMAVTGFEY